PDDDPLAQGQSVPSHLRLGIYHHDPIPCRAPRGCAIDVDNVQVYEVPTKEGDGALPGAAAPSGVLAPTKIVVPVRRRSDLSTPPPARRALVVPNRGGRAR